MLYTTVIICIYLNKTGCYCFDFGDREKKREIERVREREREREREKERKRKRENDGGWDRGIEGGRGGMDKGRGRETVRGKDRAGWREGEIGEEGNRIGEREKKKR